MLCMSCNPVQDIPEEGYLQHMKVVHGNAPQAQTMQPSVPGKPPVDPAFEQTLKEIEMFERQKKLEQSQKPQEQAVLPNSPVPVVEKPIELTYVYTGTHNGHQVQTLELDVDGKHFVIAFDPIEKKQVESREVADLKYPYDEKIQVKVLNSVIPEIEEVGAYTACVVCQKPFKNQKALSMHRMRVHK